MKNDTVVGITRAYPLRLSTDESYSKRFPNDKSTADSPFTFNIDNVQIYLEENNILLNGEMDETAYVFKIDLSQGYEIAKLTDKLTFPCNYKGCSHLY